MDFIEGLPPSEGKNMILVVVDRLSKYAHFLALTHPFSAKIVANKFIESVVKLHGMLPFIISDRDPIFISNFWREFFKLSGTQLKLSLAYHPQTSGQFEVVNRCVEQYLRCFVHQQPRKWYSLLPWEEFWYNTTYHASTEMTPFQALYGRPPPMISHNQLGLSPVNEIDHKLGSRNDLLKQLKINLQAASNQMKQVADFKRRDIEFNEDDLVFLKLHPYRQQTVFKRASHKLANIFYGPFAIEKRIGKVVYQLKLPAISRIHPVFHVSLLKKNIADARVSCRDLLPLNDDGDVVLEPEEIIDTHWVKKGRKFIPENFVKWKRMATEEATWEPTSELQDKFPDLNLENKVPVKVEVLINHEDLSIFLGQIKSTWTES